MNKKTNPPFSEIIWTPPSAATVPDSKPTQSESEEIPPDLLDAARILARELGVTVFLTQRDHDYGGILHGGPGWCITLERDKYSSHACIEPDGRQLECDVYT